MGHQEIKLAVAGLTEDQIAALDGDWSGFTEAEQAAFRFARRITHEPHQIHDGDIESLRKHYTNLQILEMVMSLAFNNYINRWKEAIGVPQEPDATMFVKMAAKPIPTDRPLPLTSFLTPTSEKFQTRKSSLAPVLPTDGPVDFAALVAGRRPPLESREEVDRMLAAARVRQSRLPLLPESEAREVLASEPFSGPLPNWVRLLANFPKDGASRIATFRAVFERSDLTPQFRAQIRWVVARQDRAWYAAGLAQKELQALGGSTNELDRLDDPASQFTAAERAAFAFARKLTIASDLLTDADVAELRRHLSDRDVVQLFSLVTQSAAFNRITEAAGLPLEE